MEASCGHVVTPPLGRKRKLRQINSLESCGSAGGLSKASPPSSAPLPRSTPPFTKRRREARQIGEKKATNEAFDEKKATNEAFGEKKATNEVDADKSCVAEKPPRTWSLKLTSAASRERELAIAKCAEPAADWELGRLAACARARDAVRGLVSGGNCKDDNESLRAQYLACLLLHDGFAALGSGQDENQPNDDFEAVAVSAAVAAVQACVGETRCSEMLEAIETKLQIDPELVEAFADRTSTISPMSFSHVDVVTEVVYRLFPELALELTPEVARIARCFLADAAMLPDDSRLRPLDIAASAVALSACRSLRQRGSPCALNVILRHLGEDCGGCAPLRHGVAKIMRVFRLWPSTNGSKN